MTMLYKLIKKSILFDLRKVNYIKKNKNKKIQQKNYLMNILKI